MLALEHVSKTYQVGAFGGTPLVAVREVTFDLRPGEVVSLIGESGSGKSTIGKMILRLIRVNGGRITIDGTDISGLKGQGLREYYRRVQGVFQDPFSSFNPIFKVEHVFSMIHGVFFPEVGAAAWRQRVDAALESVGLDTGQVIHKHPHQLSGGQLQRVLIARTLVLDTHFLVADEIISMLDASTRIDVLNLLGDLKKRGLGILFITHDLSLGNYISERTVILRRGRVVEMGATELVFGKPLHPYTKMLLAAVPQLHEKWGNVAAATDAAAPYCLYHAAHQPVAGGPDTAGSPMIEVEPGHSVGCADPDGRCAT